MHSWPLWQQTKQQSKKRDKIKPLCWRDKAKLNQ